MIRKIIRIDELKCNGCGICVNACYEGALAIINGKAKLVRDEYCDGMGNCLPVCPQSAISFEEREAAKYDEISVLSRKKNTDKSPTGSFIINDPEFVKFGKKDILEQWPIQMRLVPVNASFFKDADLVIAADCTAFAYKDFHKDFIKGKKMLIGCPKLDPPESFYKLKEIFSVNDIRSITIVKMEVPCCGGLVRIISEAIADSGKNITFETVTITIDGRIAE